MRFCYAREGDFQIGRGSDKILAIRGCQAKRSIRSERICPTQEWQMNGCFRIYQAAYKKTHRGALPDVWVAFKKKLR